VTETVDTELVDMGVNLYSFKISVTTYPARQKTWILHKTGLETSDIM
jgi:hypothetical protein